MLGSGKGSKKRVLEGPAGMWKLKVQFLLRFRRFRKVPKVAGGKFERFQTVAAVFGMQPGFMNV